MVLGSHVSEYKDYGLLRHDAALSDRQLLVQMFRRNLLSLP
jgi:hypothetical protein